MHSVIRPTGSVLSCPQARRQPCVPRRCQPAVLHATKLPHQGALEAAAKAILVSLATATGPVRAQALQGAVDVQSLWQSANNALVLGFLTFYAASAWNNSKLQRARSAEGEPVVAESAANSQPASPEQHTEALQQPASSAEPPQQASAPLVPAYATSQLGAPTAQLGMQIGAGISALQHTSPDAATATATATTEPATPHAATPPATAAAAMAVSQAELSAAPAAPGAEMTEQASAVVVLAATEPLQPASHLAQAESVSLMTAEESGHLATQPEVPTGSVTHAQAQYEAKLTEVWAASAARQAKAEGILRKREQQLAAMRPVAPESGVDFQLRQPALVAATPNVMQRKGMVSKVIEGFVMAMKRLLGMLAALTSRDRPRAVAV